MFRTESGSIVNILESGPLPVIGRVIAPLVRVLTYNPSCQFLLMYIHLKEKQMLKTGHGGDDDDDYYLSLLSL